MGRNILFLAWGEQSCLFISQTHWSAKHYVKTLLEAHFSVLFHSITPCSLTGYFVHLAWELLLVWLHGGLSKVYMLWRWGRRAIRFNRLCLMEPVIENRITIHLWSIVILGEKPVFHCRLWKNKKDRQRHSWESLLFINAFELNDYFGKGRILSVCIVDCFLIFIYWCEQIMKPQQRSHSCHKNNVRWENRDLPGRKCDWR